MAFVRKKHKKNQDYFYIVESYRDGSKVRQRTLEYIGTLENLMNYAFRGWEADQQSDKEPITFKAYMHGSCMAMYWMAKLIGIEDILDRCLPPKTVKGMKRSTILLLAMIHRSIDPESKRAFSAWAAETSLPYHLRFDEEDLTSQAFWEAMDGISEEDILHAQHAIAARAMEMTGADLKTFHLDYTNYFTFIDSKNSRCVICRRGHNKQKRDDLRQFSLAMLTSFGLQVPLIWQLYEGNKNDKQEFPDFADLVTEELKRFGIDPAETVITFDGGSNSEENFSNLTFNFICSSSLTENKQLYDIDLDEYETITLDSGHKRLAYRVDDLTFCGVTGTGILTYSKALEEGQVAELKKTLEKTEDLCDVLNENLSNPRSRLFTELKRKEKETAREIKEAVEYNEKLKQEEPKRGKRRKEKEIPVWDEKEALREILASKVYKGNKQLRLFTSAELTGSSGSYKLVWSVDEDQKDAYIRRYYGKKLTCTNMKDWSTEKILDEYSEQECIETNIFKVSKDTDHFSIRPQYHWTDDKIRVHTFICLTAMIIAEMLRLRYEDAGITISKATLLSRLSHIHDGWIFRSEKAVSRTIENLDKEHADLWNIAEKLREECSSQSNTTTETDN